MALYHADRSIQIYSFRTPTTGCWCNADFDYEPGSDWSFAKAYQDSFEDATPQVSPSLPITGTSWNMPDEIHTTVGSELPSHGGHHAGNNQGANHLPYFDTSQDPGIPQEHNQNNASTISSQHNMTTISHPRPGRSGMCGTPSRLVGKTVTFVCNDDACDGLPPFHSKAQWTWVSLLSHGSLASTVFGRLMST